MTHPFTPGVKPDTCATLLAAGDPDNDASTSGVCGLRRLDRRHAIPFGRVHEFAPGVAGCGVVVDEGGEIALCARSAVAAVHDVETLRSLDGAPMFPAKLVDRALLPPGPLFPGPEVDGRPTWFCRLIDTPHAHEWRRQDLDDEGWTDIGSSTRVQNRAWVQVRRRPPVPGDRVYVERPDRDSVPVSFAEVCEAVVGAMPRREIVPGADFAEPEHSVAVAVWRLLTEGTTGV
jgi:hypothetical protein